MTVQSALSKIAYAGSGTTGPFPVPWLFYANADITVYTTVTATGVIATLVENVGYTLTGAGVVTGGTLTTTASLAAGTTLTISLTPPLTQFSHYVPNQPFPSATVEQDLDREIQISQYLKGQVDLAIKAPASEVSPSVTLPAVAVRAGQYLAFDGAGSVVVASGTGNDTALRTDLANTTTAGKGNDLISFRRTAAEIAALVTPVNYYYPELYADRYATNTTPGTTSMTAAFQAAINVAKKKGGTITFGSGPYLIDAALDCTNPVGSHNYSYRFIGQGNAISATTTPGFGAGSLVFKHTGHAFDCTGVQAIEFENATITTDTVTFPKTCFLLARNTDASSMQVYFSRCRVFGHFSEAIVYNYGCEDEELFQCQLYNRAGTANAKTVVITQNNIRSLTSTFTTIATGAQSTIDHKFIGGEYMNFSNNAAADVFYLDTANSVKIIGPWLSCSNGSGGGRSLIYIDSTNGASSLGTVFGVTGESNAFQPAYGIRFGNEAVRTHSTWLVHGNTFPNVTAMVGSGANITVANFNLFSNNNQSLGGGYIFSGTWSGGYCEDAPGGFSAGTTNESNVDVLNKVIRRASETNLTLIDTSQAANTKQWRVRNTGGIFAIARCDDSSAVINSPLLLDGTSEATSRWRLAGKFYPPQDTAAVQTTAALYAGNGVPNNANGANGDFYLRGDTPGSANQRLYVKAAGAWVGIL